MGDGKISAVLMVLSYRFKSIQLAIFNCPGSKATHMRPSLFILLLLLIGNVSALEIDKAYRLIPHKQTVFKLNQSKIPKTEAQSVAHLLSLAEQAMVERVDALVNGPEKSGYLSQIDGISWQLSQLQMSAGIDPARAHILAAVQQHRAYFELHNVTGAKSESARQQLIQSSHHHLITAYNLLMQSYPQETKHNKQAFFDYLCALDFI
jgi:hypothetical protein